MSIPSIISSDNIKEVFDEFRETMTKGDLSEAWKEVLPIVQSGLYDNFTSAADQDGTPWPPHAPETIRRYGVHPLLVLSGKLISAATENGASGNISDIQSREMEVGVSKSDVIYAGAQNFGYKRIPPRPYMYASDQTTEKAVNEFADWAFEIIIGS